MRAGFEALAIPLGDLTFLIADSGVVDPDRGLQQSSDLPVGWTGRCTAKPSGLYCDLEGYQKGFQSLQLYENRTYFWMLRGQTPVGPPSISSSFANTGKADWQIRVIDGVQSGAFRVTNYLGTAWIGLAEESARFRFDVITSKLDAETEYRSMIEAISGECHQLILEWDSPTATPLTAAPEQAASILLERFLFLRHVLGPQRLELYLELISRRPDVRLEKIERWTHSPTDLIEFARNPLRRGRDWHFEDYKARPSEILASKKTEVFDTPANRFVKFAIHEFCDLCDDVITAFAADQGVAFLDALAMREILDLFLLAPVFQDVSALDAVPLESQVLQKREGYREILEAWLLLEVSSSIKWAGSDDTYDGTNRNVALLYEYWLYFVLWRLLRDIPQMEEVVEQTDSEAGAFPPFVQRDQRGLTVNLKEGQVTLSQFRYVASNGENLRLHLYYNRTFSPSADALSAASSYSRAFRPDFSLVIVPDYDKVEAPAHSPTTRVQALSLEKRAEAEGRIAFVHFDAKYRVETLTELFGPEPQLDSDLLAHDLGEERNLQAGSNTYKRGDLYKMHTYNDAIRRTVGSYVLYPGNSSEPTEFRRYHEILPGVGAFVVRPIFSESRPAAVGTESISTFIRDIADLQGQRFSDLYRMGYYAHDTIVNRSVRERNVNAPATLLPPRDVLVALCRANPILLAGSDLGYWWLLAAENLPTRVRIPPELLAARFLVPFYEGRTLGRYFPKKSVALVDGSELGSIIGKHGPIKPPTNALYYMLELGPSHIFAPDFDLRPYAGALESDVLFLSWSDLNLVGEEIVGVDQ